MQLFISCDDSGGVNTEDFQRLKSGFVVGFAQLLVFNSESFERVVDSSL